MYRAESRHGHSTLVSILVPETVLGVKGIGQWAWLDYYVESTWATRSAGVIAAARCASISHLASY